MERDSKQKMIIKKVNFSDDKAIEEAIQKATREALKKHKLAGNPVAVWKDGKVVLLQPHEIILD